MDGNINNIEKERKKRLQKLRNFRKLAIKKKKNSAVNKVNPLSFGKKVSQHWQILIVAVFFDLLALIPFLSVLFNFAFGLVLFLHFGPKRKHGSSELKKIVLPIAIGSIFDIFLSILPVNIAAALIRIALD
ncbi:MAG TPA: hypothetical protein ENH35_02750 [Candidatus Moranbacteria bacterium]|nr:hypothetical protein [Candidatus Moranbacteria bacterium]HDZ85436.1 hypothetical protein [Candidatus Moranbacteria bacterium]